MWGSEMHHPEPGNRPRRLAAMSGARGRAILAAAVIAAPFAIAGCGGDGGDGAIPQDSADAMLAATAEIDEANSEGDCETAQARTTDLRDEVNDLGDGQTKRALDAMVTRLDENLDEECTPTGTSEKPEPEPEETATSVPVEPETTIEETTTTTTPPEEEQPTTPEQPPNEGGGPNGPPQSPPGQSGGGGAAPPTGGIDEG